MSLTTSAVVSSIHNYPNLGQWVKYQFLANTHIPFCCLQTQGHETSVPQDSTVNFPSMTTFGFFASSDCLSWEISQLLSSVLLPLWFSLLLLMAGLLGSWWETVGQSSPRSYLGQLSCAFTLFSQSFSPQGSERQNILKLSSFSCHAFH